jgi:glutathione S-transferase
MVAAAGGGMAAAVTTGPRAPAPADIPPGGAGPGGQRGFAPSAPWRHSPGGIPAGEARMYTVTIGDKAYSSWSMRGWLLLAAFRIRFEEETVPMYTAAFEAMQRERAPARTVPMIEWREEGRVRRVWDSLAIAETLAERHPAAGIWPRDRRLREIARCLAAEMHSGFEVLRRACPMNLHRDGRPLPEPPDGLEADLDRLAALWTWALAETGGPWLAGPEFSAADAFHAPVATRLRSYALVRPETAGYAERVLGHEAVRRWTGSARADPRRIARYEEMP